MWYSNIWRIDKTDDTGELNLAYISFLVATIVIILLQGVQSYFIMPYYIASIITVANVCGTLSLLCAFYILLNKRVGVLLFGVSLFIGLFFRILITSIIGLNLEIAIKMFITGFPSVLFIITMLVYWVCSRKKNCLFNKQACDKKMKLDGNKEEMFN